MLERLKTENPSEYARMVADNSNIITNATSEHLLEDFELLREMCRGHDGENPNHVIRFVWDPNALRSTVQ